MIKERYCSYKISKLLKEKGFKIDTNIDYWKIGEDGTMYFMRSVGAYTSNPNDEYAFYRPENSYPCPTHQMAMDWLREEKRTVIIIEFDVTKRGFCPYVHQLDYDMDWVVKWSINIPMKYEEAVEVALKYSLENLI